MKKLVSLLLTLIIALSCAQAALAEEEQAAIDGIRLHTENGYVLVITYDARYAVPGETPEVTLTFTDGSTQTKTADEILHQVFTDEEKGETYPQLFIKCGERYSKCSVHVGEGAFCDDNGVQSPPVELAAEQMEDEIYDVRFLCDAKENVLTGEICYPINTGNPMTVQLGYVTGAYGGVWSRASRLTLDGEPVATDETAFSDPPKGPAFAPPTGAAQFTVLWTLNDFVWDDYTVIWHDETNDAPDKLTFNERTKYALQGVREFLPYVIPNALLAPLIGLVEALALVAVMPLAMLVAAAIPPLLVAVPFAPLYVLLESVLSVLGIPLEIIAPFFNAPTERWKDIRVYADWSIKNPEYEFAPVSVN